MKKRNHLKIGRFIRTVLAENGMPLVGPAFALGNIAPDLIYSYVFRRHTRSSSSDYLHKIIWRLCSDDIRPDGMAYSLYLGVMAHYICDFLCYPHTPAFNGSVRDHMLYEKGQSVGDGDWDLFDPEEIRYLGPARLIKKLDGDFSKREQFFLQNADAEYEDIPVALNVATWAAASVYLHASVFCPAADNPLNPTPAVK